MSRQLTRRALLSIAPTLILGTRAEAGNSQIGLQTDLGIWTDDFDGLMKRRVLRMLVPYGRTLFFQDRGSVHGVTVHAAQVLEAWINKTFKTDHRPLFVALLPTSRERLFDDLLAGRGDIAAGDISVTPERAKRVAFTVPLRRDVREIVVTPSDTAPMADAEALSDMAIAVQDGTSFQESLIALNE